MFQTLAQEIAAITADVIERAVIVTDESGRVIGASDPARLGSRHAPSIAAMRDHALRITTEEEAKRLPDGVRPGVTLPIDIDGYVVGSIAIAGAPEDVARFGTLVQKHAELFLRERALYESSILRENLRQQFLRDLLLQEQIDDESRWRERGRLLGMELPPVTCAAAFSFTMPSSRETSPTDILRRRIVHALQRPFRGVVCPFALMDEYRAALIFPGKPHADPLQEETENWCRETLRELEIWGVEGSFALGSIVSSILLLPGAWRLAAETLRIGERLRPGEKIVRSDDFALELFLASSNQDKAAALLQKHLAPLLAARSHDELLRTLDAWLANRCAPERVAASLCCHKNTLYYRLAKIHRLTGLDPRDGRDGGVLHLLLLLDQLFGFDRK